MSWDSSCTLWLGCWWYFCTSLVRTNERKTPNQGDNTIMEIQFMCLLNYSQSPHLNCIPPLSCPLSWAAAKLVLQAKKVALLCLVCDCEPTPPSSLRVSVLSADPNSKVRPGPDATPPCHHILWTFTRGSTHCGFLYLLYPPHQVSCILLYGYDMSYLSPLSNWSSEKLQRRLTA